MRLHTETPERRAYINSLPEEEKKGALTRAQNKARFISWVRNGLPEGYNEYDKVWTRED